MGNEDAVGAAPTGDAPTTSEWSTISLPTQVRLILETWRYIKLTATQLFLWHIVQADSKESVETQYQSSSVREYTAADGFRHKVPVTHKAFLSHDVSMKLPNAMLCHYNDVIMSSLASQITSPTIVYSTVYSGADQRKHQSSASRSFVRGIHRWPVNSPHKGPVARKMFPFDDVITVMISNSHLFGAHAAYEEMQPY